MSLIRGMRTSVRNNSAAYGYSVTITATFGVLSALDAGPGIPNVFLFLAGAALAFTAVELIASKGFSVTDHAQPEEVVLIATTFDVFSIATAVGAACLVGWALEGWAAWFVGSLAATWVYMTAVGLELALAERAEDEA
jgi:hypothetical protein